MDSYPYGSGSSGFTVDAAAIMRGDGLVAAADTARQQRYKRYLDFDAGKHDVGRLGVGAVALVGNYGRVFARKSASYLFTVPAVLGVDAPDDTADGQHAADRAQAALAAVYAMNDLDAVDLSTAVDAAVLGDAAFKVTWDASARAVSVVAVDVQTLSVTTAGDNVKKVLHVCQSYDVEAAVAAEPYGVSLPPGDAVAREEWTADHFRLTVGEQIVADMVNPYGFIPYVIFPNSPTPHAFWGESDLIGIMEINQALDRRLSVVNQLLEIAGNPVTVLENVDGQSGVSVSPGALWELPEGSRAYILDLLSGGAIGQHLSVIEMLYRVLHDTSEMPRTSFGDSGLAASGVALETLLQPLIQKTKRKRLIWTRALELRARMILRLLERDGLDLGKWGAAGLPLRVIWGSMLPSDTHQVAQDVSTLYGAGVYSLTTSQRMTGIEDPESEQRAIVKERANGLSAGGPPQPDPSGTPGHGQPVAVG